jgi:hypothetical protein
VTVNTSRPLHPAVRTARALNLESRELLMKRPVALLVWLGARDSGLGSHKRVSIPRSSTSPDGRSRAARLPAYVQ